MSIGRSTSGGGGGGGVRKNFNLMARQLGSNARSGSDFSNPVSVDVNAAAVTVAMQQKGQAA